MAQSTTSCPGTADGGQAATSCVQWELPPDDEDGPDELVRSLLAEATARASRPGLIRLLQLLLPLDIDVAREAHGIVRELLGHTLAAGMVVTATLVDTPQPTAFGVTPEEMLAGVMRSWRNCDATLLADVADVERCAAVQRQYGKLIPPGKRHAA